MSEQIVQQPAATPLRSPPDLPGREHPRGARWISNVVQARYYSVVVRDTFLRGAGWSAMWWQIPPVCAIGLEFYTLAWRTMRRMQVNA